MEKETTEEKRNEMKETGSMKLQRLDRRAGGRKIRRDEIALNLLNGDDDNQRQHGLTESLPQRSQQDGDAGQNGADIRENLEDSHKDGEQQRVVDPKEEKSGQRCHKHKQTGFEHAGKIAHQSVFAPETGG